MAAFQWNSNPLSFLPEAKILPPPRSSWQSRLHDRRVARSRFDSTEDPKCMDDISVLFTCGKVGLPPYPPTSGDNVKAMGTFKISTLSLKILINV
ncbi:hypothetical protein AVEN_112590-1 [Araneus ventricosus]|uniref:Uncharacterized protein n=1 Tax=Araneus ventricosus TaxID=182803 RepID=A0A4Y2L2M3_ARAVE|nr:hypothetical protein AVEN_112590-1 [Araneus ventricosus]